jgi:hypothetical protein
MWLRKNYKYISYEVKFVFISKINSIVCT